MFQHTAARRRLGQSCKMAYNGWLVSTHSRPKAAGEQPPQQPAPHKWFQHTAARRRLEVRIYCILVTQAVSTHSRPKAAGKASPTELIAVWFQHTAARRRLGRLTRLGRVAVQFQHTAARRRLVAGNNSLKLLFWVSTHSRPKAAGA